MEKPAQQHYSTGLFKGLTPNVFRMGWVSFLADISSEMLYPVIPIFLTTVIGAPVSVVGLIEGCAEAISSLLKTHAGRLSDRLGRRKPFIVGGYLFSACARPLLAVAFGWPLVLVARCLDRVGKGIRSSPRDALLADSVEREYIGKALGWHRGIDTLGAVVGPLVALLFIESQPGHLRWIFLLAFIPGLFAVLLALTVREVPRPHPIGLQTADRGSHPDPAIQSSTSFRNYLIAWACFSLTNSSDMFLILRAKEVGFETHSVILLYCFYNLVYAAASPFLGHLSDRLGRKSVLVGGLVVFAGVYGAFALAQSSATIWALYGIYGLYMAATDGVSKALAVDLVPRTLRGGAIGQLGTVTGLSLLVSSSVAGWLWTNVGSYAAFYYGAAGALVGATLIAFSVQTKSAR